MKILCLNCQKAYHPNLNDFLRKTFHSNVYDFLLLQEVDEKVLSLIEEARTYKNLGALNYDNQKQSHLSIVYRDSYVLKDHDFVSFAKMNTEFALRAEPGFLIGKFECNGTSLVVGSVHFHPGSPFYIRAKEAHIVKDKCITWNGDTLPTLFGGDLNLVWPWEVQHTKRILAPQFKDVTSDIGPTLDSLYTEKGTRFTSRFGNFLASLGISLKFKTDCIYVDEQTSKNYKITSYALPDRVSDHSPVELFLEPLLSTPHSSC